MNMEPMFLRNVRMSVNYRAIQPKAIYKHTCVYFCRKHTCDVKQSSCLTKYYAMKAYGGADVYIHVFLTLIVVSFTLRSLLHAETGPHGSASPRTEKNIPEDDILHRYRRENLKSYIALTGWTV
jgi:hypothetical protein